MNRPPVRPPGRIDTAEQESIASCTAMLEAKLWETCFPAAEILIEVEENGCRALATRGDLVRHRRGIKIIAVERKLLANSVAQHLRHLEAGQWCVERRSDPCPDEFDDAVEINEVEEREPVGSSRMYPSFAGFLVVDDGAFKPGLRGRDEPGAFTLRQKPFDRPDQWICRKCPTSRSPQA